MTSVNTTFNNSLANDCTNRGVFINFPATWEAAKWIRLTEFIFTVLLNSILIGVLRKNWNRNNVVYFIVHLAISDICVAFFHILPLTIGHFNMNWTYGIILCKLKFYTSNVSLYLSTYLILALTIDRLLSVKYPLGIFRKYPIYRRTSIGIPLVLALLINIPMLFFTKIRHRCGVGICSPDIRDFRQIVILVDACLRFIIPTLTLMLCYGTIGYCLYVQNENMRFLVFTKLGNGKTQPPANFHPVITKAKKRNAIMTFVVSLTFIGSYLPSILAGLLNLYGHLGFGGWFDILIALAPLNSLLNPIIFVVFNAETVKKVLRSSRNHMGS